MQNNETYKREREREREREVGSENGWKIGVENWMKSLIEK